MKKILRIDIERAQKIYEVLLDALNHMNMEIKGGELALACMTLIRETKE